MYGCCWPGGGDANAALSSATTGVMTRRCDLLLVNCSNAPHYPIYPYAFVQVAALARKQGLIVEAIDPVFEPPARRVDVIRERVRRCQPAMVGFTLRQLDGQDPALYVNRAGERTEDAFFPVDDTRDAIDAVRTVTRAPIVVGGFGFTTDPAPLMTYLGADYGVMGEPDDLMRHFQDVVHRVNLGGVRNLAYFEHGEIRLNERCYFPPLDEREYDDEAAANLRGFYGDETWLADDGPHVPVEIARGCPYRCFFCTEPFVKGRAVRERDLDAVMGDVEFLSSFPHFQRFWFVCSELNVGSNDLALRVAARMLAFNAGRATPVTWTCYYLPKWLSLDDLRLLARSGFRGGWNEYPSLEDHNLKQSMVPYRAKDALENFEHVRTVVAETGRAWRKSDCLEFFLGGAFSTPESVATTLSVLSDSGLSTAARSGDIVRGTRVYRCIAPALGQPSVITVARDGRHETDLIHPTFCYPPALIEPLGSVAALDAFFAHVETTFLSVAYLDRYDWSGLLRSAIPRSVLVDSLRDLDAAGVVRLDRQRPETVVSALLLANLSEARVAAFCDPPRQSERDVYNRAARLLLEGIAAAHEPIIADLVRAMGFDETDSPALERWRRLSPYRVAEHLYRRYASNQGLRLDAQRRMGFPDQGLASLLLEHLLAGKGVDIRPEYSPLLFRVSG